MIFPFPLEHTIAGVLLQKNEQNLEHHIYFYSKALRDSTLKYEIMEKHAYALVKALKELRVYILHSGTIVYVPSTTIKDILTQAEPDGRREKWIATLLEYNLVIRPTNLVKGQGLEKLMAQSNCEVLGMNSLAHVQKMLLKLRKGRYIHISFLPLVIRTSYMSCKSFKIHLN